MIQLPPMEESEAVVVLVALATLHQGLTNSHIPDFPARSLSSELYHELVTGSVRVGKRVRALMGVKPLVCVGEVHRHVGPNMASAVAALCALLVKRLERMPQRAELAGRVAAEIRQLEAMWQATKQLDGKEHES